MKPGTYVSPYLEGLTAYYQFDELEGVVVNDYLGNRNGTNYGAEAGVTGAVDKGYSFDGVADYVDLEGNAGITGYPFSITHVVYLPDVTTNRIFINGSDTATYKGVTLYNVGSVLRVRIGDGGGSATANRRDIQSAASALNGGTWNVIQLNCTAYNTFEVIANGVEKSMSYVSGGATAIDFDNNYVFGHAPPSTFYEITTDETLFWNKTWSLSEFADMRTRVLAGVPVIGLPLPVPVVVTNLGVVGDNTSEIAARMTNTGATLTYVLGGANDFGHPVAGTRRTAAQYKTNLETIVDTAVANGSQVVLVSFPPRVSEDPNVIAICAYPEYGLPSDCDTDALTVAYRDKMVEVVNEKGTMYVDIHQEFIAIGQPTDLITSYMQNIANSGEPDGTHPVAIGAAFIAQKLYDHYVLLGLTDVAIDMYGNSIIRGWELIGAGTSTGETIPAVFQTLANA